MGKKVPAPFASLVIAVVERIDVDADVDEVMVDVIVDGRLDPLTVMVDVVVVGGGRTKGAFAWLTSQTFPWPINFAASQRAFAVAVRMVSDELKYKRTYLTHMVAS
jgi:hypothetical protein